MSSEEDKDPLTPLLSRNTTWRTTISRTHPTLLPSLSSSQSPSLLWLGCSDSRVPETTILDLLPGDVFAHRNIANIVAPGDASVAAVLQYAVKVLKVRTVVLCGHVGCGGVKAALALAVDDEGEGEGRGMQGLERVREWIEPLREVGREVRGELERCGSEGEREGLLCRANVRRGLEVLRGNEDVREAVRERGMQVRGVVYDVGTGRLEVCD